MKKVLVIFGLLVAFAIGQNMPRMRLLGTEDVKGSVHMWAYYMHDNETKQEITCILYDREFMSCYPTGRTW